MIERVKQIIEYYKLNPYAFSQKISVSEGTIRKYLGGKIGMKVETLAKILVTFDEVNPDWLLLGKGEMLRKATQNSSTSPLFDLDFYKKSIDNMQDLIDYQKHEIGRLRSELAKEKEKNLSRSDKMTMAPTLP